MTPRRPEEWPRLFVDRLNASDLDGDMALYEPDARFFAPMGETLVGRDRIREVVAELVRAKTRLECRVVKWAAVEDVAVLYTDFDGTQVDASGNEVEVSSRAIEVLRRKEDGGWKLIVGDPNGRR